VPILDDLQVQVGARVRDLRLAHGLTQETLAERSGLSYKFVGEVERGKANPTIRTLKRLAMALAVEIPEFFARSTKTVGPHAVYQIRTRNPTLVREALESEGTLVTRLRPPARPARRPLKKSAKSK
jgi:transcriptional regulator with XRE-family HTH domain